MSVVEVVKLSGSGNDFLALGPESALILGDALPDWIRRVCRRGLSVGADGVLLVRPAGGGRVAVTFHNPDASIAFCGNGTRCAARFAAVEGLAGNVMVLETAVGSVPARVRGTEVALDLPAPRDRGILRFQVGGDRLIGRWIDSGVPHVVLAVDDLDHAPLERWGPALRRDPQLGDPGANVDLVRIGPDGVALRTWERGVEGETLSCGTGAVAAAFAARLAGGAARQRVVPRSGVPLDVEFSGPAGSPQVVHLEGDARIVFRGSLDREAVSGFDE